MMKNSPTGPMPGPRFGWMMMYEMMIFLRGEKIVLDVYQVAFRRVYGQVALEQEAEWTMNLQCLTILHQLIFRTIRICLLYFLNFSHEPLEYPLLSDQVPALIVALIGAVRHCLNHQMIH